MSKKAFTPALKADLWVSALKQIGDSLTDWKNAFAGILI
jgi:hypothetical protein